MADQEVTYVVGVEALGEHLAICTDNQGKTSLLKPLIQNFCSEILQGRQEEVALLLVPEMREESLHRQGVGKIALTTSSDQQLFTHFV